MEMLVDNVFNFLYFLGDKIDRGGKNIMDMYVNCFILLF